METHKPMSCLADVKAWARGALESLDAQKKRGRLDRDMANVLIEHLSGQGLVTGETWEDYEHAIPHRGWVVWVENNGRLRLRHCIAYAQSDDGTKNVCVMAVSTR